VTDANGNRTSVTSCAYRRLHLIQSLADRAGAGCEIGVTTEKSIRACLLPIARELGAKMELNPPVSSEQNP
jgi:hypothetical protein